MSLASNEARRLRGQLALVQRKVRTTIDGEAWLGKPQGEGLRYVLRVMGSGRVRAIHGGAYKRRG